MSMRMTSGRWRWLCCVAKCCCTPDSCMPFSIWMSTAPLLRLWSLSVPPPAPPEKPMRWLAAVRPPSMAQAVPTSAAAAPATARPPAAAPAAPATPSAASPAVTRIRRPRPRPPQRPPRPLAPEAAASAALAKPSAASASAIWLWEASMSWMAPCFLQGRALPCALKQGLHLGRPPYDLWWGHSSGGGARPWESWECTASGPRPRPRIAAPSAYCLAPSPRPAMAVSAAWMPDSLSRLAKVGGCGASKPALPHHLPGRPREGLPAVALVVGLEGLRGVDVGVGHRLVAQGLRALGEIVEVEVAGQVDRSIALRQLQADGLPFLDVAQHLAVVGPDPEAVLAPLLHAFLRTRRPRLPTPECSVPRPRPSRRGARLAGAYLSCGRRRLTVSVSRPTASVYSSPSLRILRFSNHSFKARASKSSL